MTRDTSTEAIERLAKHHDLLHPKVETVTLFAETSEETAEVLRALAAERDRLRRDRDTLAKQAEDCARTCAEQADRIKALQDPLSDAVKWADRFLWAAEWVDPAREALKAEPAPGQIERVSLADLEGYGTNNAPRHPDDEAVDRFAAAMKAKLAVKRADGRGGWDDKAQCSQKFLSDLLRGHVDKGDPVDVANFAMMLHQRGEMIAPVPEIETAPITFTYTNWRGETAQRTAVPKRIWFGSTDWHPEPGWLMTAHDLEKAADRDFALADCVFSAPRQSVQDAARQAIECIKADWREFCGYPEDHPTGKMHPVWAFRRLCALAQGAQGDE